MKIIINMIKYLIKTEKLIIWNMIILLGEVFLLQYLNIIWKILISILTIIFCSIRIFIKIPSTDSYTFNKSINNDSTNFKNFILLIVIMFQQIIILLINEYLIKTSNYWEINIVSILLLTIISWIIIYFIKVYNLKKSDLNNYKNIRPLIKDKESRINSCLKDVNEILNKNTFKLDSKKDLIKFCDALERTNLFYKDLLEIKKHLEKKQQIVRHNLNIMNLYPSKISKILSINIEEYLLKYVVENIKEIDNFINKKDILNFITYYNKSNDND